jgi:hypothetical protein
MGTYIIIGGDGKEYGPITEADVRQWIAEGRLNAQSLAKSVSDAEFRPLDKFPELSDLWIGGTPAIISPLQLSGPEWLSEVTTRQPELRLGECLAAGWSFLGANAGFLVGAVLLSWSTLLLFTMGSVFIPLIGPIIAVCMKGVILGGFYLACLRRMRGESVAATDVFDGFKHHFVQLLLTGLIVNLLTGFALCCFVLPALSLLVAWVFALPLVADRKMFFWSAMEVSRKVVTKVWFEVLVLILIAFLPLVCFQVYSLVTTGNYFFGLYQDAGHNWQQWAQMMQSHSEEIRKLTLQATLIGQAVLLVNFFYFAGVIIRAYENLFGAKKP